MGQRLYGLNPVPTAVGCIHVHWVPGPNGYQIGVPERSRVPHR